MPGSKWECIANDAAIQRSSHILSILDHKVYIFGGELIPRQPRDNKIIVVDLASSANGFPINEVSSTDNVPVARVGSASTTLSSNLYIFSGRRGLSMFPTEERGGMWCFNPRISDWSLITPSDPSAPYPASRSYHCMASDGVNQLFVHAGCPASGRLSDLWSFSLREQAWTQLADAPGPARGGTSLAFSNGRLYRMNGFDGKHEQGGVIDVYDLQNNEWTSRGFVADGQRGPEARSVSVLLPVEVGGKMRLVTLFGERDPSNFGHAGAGKMLGDVWLYDIENGSWQKEAVESDEVPPARGWCDADVFEKSKVIVAGGLNELNERLDDIWVLSL